MKIRPLLFVSLIIALVACKWNLEKLSPTKVTTLSTPGPIDMPELEFVEGDTFQMGRSRKHNQGCTGCYFDELPVHKVFISDFEIGKNEITYSQFKSFIDSTGYITSAELVGHSFRLDINNSRWIRMPGINWRHDPEGKLRNDSTERNYPVVHVSYEDAIEYCKWLSEYTLETYRLPTEAEWEFAARGGSNHETTVFAGSDDPDQVAWYKGEMGRVEMKKSNKLGLHDMSGNVYEWCMDNYVEDIYQQRANADSIAIDPVALNSDELYVARGGTYIFNVSNTCRVANRGAGDRPSAHFGFRIVKVPK